MIDRNYNIWLLALILIFIVSCFGGNVPQFQTNSEHFLPGFSVAIGQELEDLNFDSSVFGDSGGGEDYEKWTHLDSIFESNVFMIHTDDWNQNIYRFYINRELRKDRNSDKIDREEVLNNIKHIWLNCNIPTDKIDSEVAAIKKATENNTMMNGVVHREDYSEFKESYSWSYGKQESNRKYNSLVLHYSAMK